MANKTINNSISTPNDSIKPEFVAKKSPNVENDSLEKEKQEQMNLKFIKVAKLLKLLYPKKFETYIRPILYNYEPIPDMNAFFKRNIINRVEELAKATIAGWEAELDAWEHDILRAYESTRVQQEEVEKIHTICRFLDDQTDRIERLTTGFSDLSQGSQAEASQLILKFIGSNIPQDDPAREYGIDDSTKFNKQDAFLIVERLREILKKRVKCEALMIQAVKELRRIHDYNSVRVANYKIERKRGAFSSRAGKTRGEVSNN